MKLPDYVTKDEVKRVCKELGIRNWAALKKVASRVKEAIMIKAAIHPITETRPIAQPASDQ